MAADEIADRLYGLSPGEFTRARNEAAAELRKAGRKEDADAVKALRKPTATAAAVNRLVREHGEEVEHFLDAAAALRDAQFAGKGDLAQATKRQRDVLTKLTGLGGAQVRQSLEAAAVDDEAAAELRRAQLVQELEPRGFGTLTVEGAPQPPPRPAAKPKRDDRAARARLRERQQELAAARAEERQAQSRLEQARKEVGRAEAAVAEAQRALDRAL